MFNINKSATKSNNQKRKLLCKMTKIYVAINEDNTDILFPNLLFNIDLKAVNGYTYYEL